jgi:4-cresol dehydrogenase (hydroxylating)
VSQITSTIAPVLEALYAILSPEKITLPGDELSRTLQNTSQFEPPEVLAWLRPAHLEEVVSIIKICRTFKTPVYTISNGFNWGLGSRLPYEDNCILLELSGLNKILEINEQFHYAIVEPGVSQGQLSAEIQKLGIKAMLNVTGSAPQSSVLGNTMERGSGFMEHRIKDLRGMEVLMADGSLLRSGFWNTEPSERQIHHFPMGIGPDWKGLFTQSNLGIVTKMVVNLYPKKEIQKMIWCKVSQENLPALVEAFADLYQRSYIDFQ